MATREQAATGIKLGHLPTTEYPDGADKPWPFAVEPAWGPYSCASHPAVRPPCLVPDPVWAGYRLMISGAGKCVLAGECGRGRWGSWTNHTYSGVLNIADIGTIPHILG
jgi:hypothetical protein